MPHGGGKLRRSRKRRQGTELLCEWVFRPLAHLVVLVLAPLRVPPPAVVLAATATGLLAAFELAHGHLVLAAILLQVKTVLDNADGQLARLTGRESVLGRYLDSESDLLVDAALLAALGSLTGEHGLALAAFVVLTLVLGINFNVERLYRRERGATSDPMPAGIGASRGSLERVYGVVYAPQDRLVEGFIERRLARARAGTAGRLAYHDRWTVAVIANFGLSTQLAALGLCLALGRPAALPLARARVRARGRRTRGPARALAATRSARWWSRETRNRDARRTGGSRCNGRRERRPGVPELGKAAAAAWDRLTPVTSTLPTGRGSSPTSRRSSPRSAWISKRRERGTPRGGSCGRSTTPPPDMKAIPSL